MPNYTILMGDVVDSMGRNHLVVQSTLTHIIEEANKTFRNSILSPLTITLGDEFQGVIQNFEAALKIMFWLDEQAHVQEPPQNMRYSIVYGNISTSINNKIAHGMIGEGLQLARKLVSEKKRPRRKFQMRSGDENLDKRLNQILLVTEGVINKWSRKDFKLIHELIAVDNDHDVGAVFDKTRQQIYKRRKTLMIKEYKALKNLAIDFGAEVGGGD